MLSLSLYISLYAYFSLLVVCFGLTSSVFSTLLRRRLEEAFLLFALHAKTDSRRRDRGNRLLLSSKRAGPGGEEGGGGAPGEVKYFLQHSARSPGMQPGEGDTEEAGGTPPGGLGGVRGYYGGEKIGMIGRSYFVPGGGSPTGTVQPSFPVTGSIPPYAYQPFYYANLPSSHRRRNLYFAALPPCGPVQEELKAQARRVRTPPMPPIYRPTAESYPGGRDEVTRGAVGNAAFLNAASPSTRQSRRLRNELRGALLVP
ncbi:hypothetical protein CSUI_010893, partial [Cystoisospora suis]